MVLVTPNRPRRRTPMVVSTRAYSYIRFSTPEQARGDSLHRQLERTTAYCQRNGLVLDDSLDLRDLGKSAFRGGNADTGRLAAFLEAVKTNRVPKGSVLIVENLDRLSRNEIQPALQLVLGLLQAGIRIAQLTPSELVFDSKSDAMAVMLMLVELSRGHAESKVKSDRVSAAWEEKRANVAERKLTGACPFWLKLAPCGTKFVKLAENVALVRRIFQMAK